MPARVVRVEGAARLRRTLRQAGADLSDLAEANRQAAQITADAGAASAPRVSGKLAGSIRPRGTPTQAIVRAYARYGLFVHWGTVRLTGRPFLVDAAHATEPRWLPIYESAVDRALDHVKGI